MGFENKSISVPFHWSGSVWAITMVMLVVLAVAAFYIESREWPTVMLWLKYLLRVVFLITIIGGLAYTPIRLTANDEKITVKKLSGALEIPLSEVIEVRQISKSYIDGTVQTFASGGFFGYLGRFKNDRLGNYTMYATEFNNLVFVRTHNKKYVFSCSQARNFVEYINSRLMK